MKNIGFIGIGIMGKPMVLNLLKAGFSVFVLEKSGRSQEVHEAGAHVCSSVKQLVESVDIVISMLPDSPEVEAVLFGSEGIMHMHLSHFVGKASTRSSIVSVKFITADPIFEIASPIFSSKIRCRAVTLSVY